MRLFKKKEKEERGLCSAALTYSGGTATNVSPMRLAAVYRCVQVISDSVAQLPLSLYGDGKVLNNHPAYNLVSKEPSPLMTRFTFLKCLVSSMLLQGNGYAYIRRDQLGNAREIIYLDGGVTIMPKSDGSIAYNVKGIGEVSPRDMLHILNHSVDGINGISTIAYASQTLGLANASEAHAQGFFTGGANVGGILAVQGPLNQKQADDIKSKWNNAFGPVGTPNGIAVIPGNMTFQTVTVNPSDAQLLETRQYSVVDICRFFGVSPVKCFDLTHSSYSTVEATQLAFLTDTLAPILEKIELEMERKLFRDDEKWHIDVRFDTAALLRADTSSRTAYYNAMFNMGAVSANEVRAEMGLPPIENGDEHFVQVNLQTLSRAVSDTSNDTDKQNQDNND